MLITCFRQIHLDFHTSPHIKDIASEFVAEDFARTLKDSYVNSVTFFAKCHHGMSYYPTKVGVVHPYLKIDLLGETVRACHKYGIRVPVYYSVCWDNYMGMKHPEWLQCDQEGTLVRPKPYEPGWYTLCLNTPYADYVTKQVEEILLNYEIDGFFFDIVYQTRPGCLCKYCCEGMEKEGLDITNEQNLLQYSSNIERNFMDKIVKLVHSKKPGVTIFFNGQVDFNLREKKSFFSHIEIESLPTAKWGYYHFPFFVRFVRTIFKEYVGMTARFHKSWGDFGGIKTKAQLEYECAIMLANGAKCSIGDQLHPRGKLDKAVYSVIGDVYKDLAEKEPWCKEAEPLTEVAILLTDDFINPTSFINYSYKGAVKMLIELKHQFDIIDTLEDFSKYKIIILPDNGKISEKTCLKLEKYLAHGGSIILSHEATLENKDFKCPGTGVRYIGPAEYSPDYIELEENVSKGMPKFKFVMYEQGSYVIPCQGAEVLANIWKPYFNRTFRTFTSHSYAPADKKTIYPAIVKNKNVIYIYAPIFKAYYIHGYFVYKKVVENILRILLPNPLVQTNAPSSAEVTLTKQHNKIVAHIVNFQPQRRGESSEYIEEVHPVKDIQLAVRTVKEPRTVYLAPSKRMLEYSFKHQYTFCVVPQISIHQMVIFEL